MNLIVYGSLINKKELEKEGISLFDVLKVRVYGFRRVFNQEPSYRLISSINRAVLNIEEQEESFFNAIIIKNLSREYFEILDKRERGYNRVLIEAKKIEPYDENFLEDAYVYLGKKEKKSSQIFPNEEYLNICLEGVKSFGNSFLEEFKNSTYKNTKEGLSLI